MEIRATSYSTRGSKLTRQMRKAEDSKIVSEQATKGRNASKQIEKPKSPTGKKPQEPVGGKLSKQKKIHNCAICLKVFKGKGVNKSQLGRKLTKFISVQG